MGKKTIETCPCSRQTPPAVVDDDGWCYEHGWDCEDFDLDLADLDEVDQT